MISVEAKPSDFYEEPVILTGLGHVRGSVLRSRLGELFYAFRGIRYAKPPVGDLRFKVSCALKRVYDLLPYGKLINGFGY